MNREQRSSALFYSSWPRGVKSIGAIAIVLLLSAVRTSPQTKPLVLAVEDAAGPWSMADGTGYANDIVTAAFKAVGVEVELRLTPYARCKRMAINGDVAGCFNMSTSPELEGVIELSAKPLFIFYAGYFYNVSKPLKVTRQADLPLHTIVGTVLGYEYPPAFERLRADGVVVVDESPSESINLKKLVLGRVDLALLTYNEIKSPAWLTGRAGVNGQVKIAFRSGVMSCYIGFSKRHPQGAWALQQFNTGYQLISANGTLQRIRRTWLQKLKSEVTPSRR
jgi:polar amino acid transport system substrate-binding protein